MSLIAAIIVGLVLSAASIAVSELLKPKTDEEDQRPPNAGEFTFPTAIEGRVVPIIFGTVLLKGPNVVWWGDLKQVAVRKKVRTGLFSKKRQLIAFNGFVGIHMGLCRGPIDAVTRILVNDREIFSGDTLSPIAIDLRNFFGGDENGNGGLFGTVDVIAGTETQAVNTYLATQQSVVPAYRGTAALVLHSTDPNSINTGFFIGNSTQIEPWAIEARRIPNGLAFTGGEELVNTKDSNPANVIFELITNTEWGWGFPASDINTTNFTTVGTTLKTEGNGFSFTMDKAIESAVLLNELERQIDGILIINPATGKFEINLVRGGFDVNTIPQIDDTNLLEIKDFAPSSWDETVNFIHISFADRSRDYFETTAIAYDLANQRIQGGETVTVTENYPGVKNESLANNIASREIRQLARPLAKATVTVDRSLFALKLGDVIAFTNTELDKTKFAMRVSRIDIGRLAEGEIELGLVEDAFAFDTSIFGDPDPTNWIVPVNDVAGIPAVDQVIIEPPKKITDLDEENTGVIDVIWCAARSQGTGEFGFTIFHRNDPVTPSGAFTEDTTVYDHILIGKVRTEFVASEDQDGAGPLEMNADPDTLASLVGAFINNASEADIGVNMVNLIFVGDGTAGEFMGVTSASDQTTHVNLNTVFRGIMDTVPQLHAVGTRIFLMFKASGLSEFILPPAQMKVNTALYPASADIDTQRPSTSGLDNIGYDVFYIRRDFLTITDEIVNLRTDAGTLNTNFPVINDTKYGASVTDDPGGSPTVLFSTGFLAGGSDNIFLSRTTILANNAGVVPTTLKFDITTQHLVEGTLFEATQFLNHAFTVLATTIGNDTNLAVLATNVVSTTYVAPDTGTYTLTRGAGIPGAFTTGTVEAKVGTSLFFEVIATTLITGTIDNLAASATINAGGTGYTNGDVLTLDTGNGTFTTVATFTVTGESSGVVTSVGVTQIGNYSVTPTNPVSTTGGTGSGCTLDVTFTTVQATTDTIQIRHTEVTVSGNDFAFLQITPPSSTTGAYALLNY